MIRDWRILRDASIDPSTEGDGKWVKPDNPADECDGSDDEEFGGVVDDDEEEEDGDNDDDDKGEEPAGDKEFANKSPLSSFEESSETESDSVMARGEWRGKEEEAEEKEAERGRSDLEDKEVAEEELETADSIIVEETVLARSWRRGDSCSDVVWRRGDDKEPENPVSDGGVGVDNPTGEEDARSRISASELRCSNESDAANPPPLFFDCERFFEHELLSIVTATHFLWQIIPHSFQVYDKERKKERRYLSKMIRKNIRKQFKNSNKRNEKN